MQVKGSALYQSDDDEVDDGVGSMSREERLGAPNNNRSASANNRNASGSNEFNLCLEEVDDIDTLMSRLYLQANPNDIK